MSNATTTNAAVSSAPTTDDSAASTITVNTKTPNFPPPKTDKPRPHVCATCQRSFARLEHLKRHERSHTKEKPFECPECARCFARRDLLLRHQQKLHNTTTPSARPRNRRESASGVGPGQSRARKNSIVGANGAGPAGAATSMRPRANTISHIDPTAIQFMTASVSTPRGMPSTHNRHHSLIGLPMHNFDHAFTSMSTAMMQRGVQHTLPKLETNQLGSGDFNLMNGLRTAPALAGFDSDFDFDSLYLAGNSTINPNALHLSDSPQSMAIEQTPPFGASLGDMASIQSFDDGYEWLTGGFEHQMSFQANDAVVDESSPSALSTASQSGISDVMVDGSNHPVPAGTSTMWQPSVMGPPQLPNPFAMDINGSVFPDLLNGAPLSPQPASQKINDPYFSAPSQSLSSLSPSIVSGLTAQSMNQSFGYNAGPEALPPVHGGILGASPVTTITDATRNAIVNALSHCLPFGARRFSFTSQGSPQSPQVHNSGTSCSQGQATSLPSTQDLRRYVAAYLSYFHPHLPFLHVPTLSFDMSAPSCGHSQGIGGNGCLMLSMAAIGALYEKDNAQSRELFEMAKKLIFFYLEERRKADVRRADFRRSTPGITEHGYQSGESSTHTPVWLVQAMLLNVVYGHNCGEKTASDIASTHCAALVSLAQAADLLRPERAEPSDNGNVRMENDGSWGVPGETDMHTDWLRWKAVEERKRTLFIIFILSSMLVAAYNHPPALTNTEIFLDLPCDEDFFSAGSARVFSAKGGIEAANHNCVKFHDALGEILRAGERQKPNLPKNNSPPLSQFLSGDVKPSAMGCLVLINALHNYIWESRQRHHNEVWSTEETEKMHQHVEPALKAWQAAWASNPQHSLERPNPFGMGPISADAIPLLDLAYVRLFVNLSRSKEKFWQRDWEGLAEELSRGAEIIQHADSSPASNSESSGTDPSDVSMQSSVFMDSPVTQTSPGDLAPGKAAPISTNSSFSLGTTSRREKHLRKAAFYAADSLAMASRLGVTIADLTSHELPLQSAMCTFDCSQVLAEWIASLQDRVGQYVGILSQDVDLSQCPAVMLLEDEDVKLLEKVQEILAYAEAKMNMDIATGGMDGIHSDMQSNGQDGYAARILRVTAYMLDKSAVWPVTHLMARCLETHASHVRERAKKSTSISQ
ncbi:hypothetical protein S40288_04249 [Stachybotrys chartarum IBT 40288]|nr:hypothetical protein S40288_04249 [Stachybotrys chartarum IBT 40288]